MSPAGSVKQADFTFPPSSSPDRHHVIDSNLKIRGSAVTSQPSSNKRDNVAAGCEPLPTGKRIRSR
ncbi:hypothetical protein BDY19DRAFT_942547 [Irpex rosettiformis]|uniref:Uncharacterized protein n=1 Tax=Irpex rosettiformis TaxID=378272 RepID=A0ACB8U5L0_9APHY|nr:hypothetical protein BDY19DRAFT_942547 [Irpex rosettiformis]